jgi:hypothetical protein
MVYAFVLGIMVTLTPSLVAVAWLVWLLTITGSANDVTASSFLVGANNGQVGPKADIRQRDENVRYGLKADMARGPARLTMR